LRSTAPYKKLTARPSFPHCSAGLIVRLKCSVSAPWGDLGNFFLKLDELAVVLGGLRQALASARGCLALRAQLVIFGDLAKACPPCPRSLLLQPAQSSAPNPKFARQLLRIRLRTSGSRGALES